MVERLFRKHSACAVFSVRTTAVANTAFWQRFRCMVGLMRGSFHQLLEVNCVRTVGANKQAKRSKSTPSAPAWIQILVVVCLKEQETCKRSVPRHLRCAKSKTQRLCSVFERTSRKHGAPCLLFGPTVLLQLTSGIWS